MKLLPKEIDKLLLIQAGTLAQRRLARGVRLNHVEAVALICTVLIEHVRDGIHSLSTLASIGTQLLGKRQVLPQVSSSLDHVSVEATFPDGTKLITVHNPISTLDGNLEEALYGSFLPVPSLDKFPPVEADDEPGKVIVVKSDIILNQGRNLRSVVVTNNGDRPIQVGSHYHFVETNAQLSFDRELAYGYRLNIPAGTAVRFEPGEKKKVDLVEIAGNKVISGGNGLATGKVDLAKIPTILKKIQDGGFLHVKQSNNGKPNVYKMSRERYAAAYGPTVGDKVRLGDSSLYLEIERDYTSYGDECVFGGGKVIREGMGQATGVKDGDALDLVIVNVIVVDYTGIYKADIGIKNGYIVGIGKAGNPDVMHGVTPGMIIGATTEVLAGEGKIITAGAIDTHIHFICPQICTEALYSGITTVIGGGTGPNTGTNATTCTPGKFHIKAMYKSTDDLPLNFGFTGKGNSSSAVGLEEQIEAGAIGLKLHEDWGTTPSAIDTCLKVCDKYDIQATIHTDTLNESGFVETSIAAFKSRTIHAYHTEGAGGGHAPDIISVCGELNVIPSSTNPTRPFTKNTLDEHLDMLMVCHHLSKDIPEDISFAESRIRGETIGAEDILHDNGSISIISSDSQAMGRVGEVICRTWQTAHKMKLNRGKLSKNEKGDNDRIKRYVSKYTINPALAHGISHVVGSIEVGKLADLVLYSPSFFGTKPDLVLKGGLIVSCQMGDPNASIPTPQPVHSRPMFGSFPAVLSMNCFAFISKASELQVAGYNLKKKLVPVKGCRSVKKTDMKHNSHIPKISVDPETYQVTCDGEILKSLPSDKLPMAQSVFLI
ncbi:hypothetical protein HDV04_004312 [Boothiomyces sp. JEL0838]|nr:hypothetical protein HDV04_004312 [Boothiomyces sp. JEL0838]